MMVGIPLYGAEPARHDYVVQAEGAFNETVRGILNLGQLRQRIEIRVVLHKQTAPVLPEIAEFIASNIPFVDQVALMGLEMIGLARANIAELWIDPTEYADELVEAVTLLDRSRIHTMIYNHQLCLIAASMWPLRSGRSATGRTSTTPSASTAVSKTSAAASSSRPNTRSARTSRQFRPSSPGVVRTCCHSRKRDGGSDEGRIGLEPARAPIP